MMAIWPAHSGSSQPLRNFMMNVAISWARGALSQVLCLVISERYTLAAATVTLLLSCILCSNSSCDYDGLGWPGTMANKSLLFHC